MPAVYVVIYRKTGMMQNKSHKIRIVWIRVIYSPLIESLVVGARLTKT